MSSEFGRTFRVSVFGESHGKSIGVVIDGAPAGEAVDMDELSLFMARRRPGSALSTKRSEPDVPVFLSGVTDGVTNGFPICAVIENTDTRSKDYSQLWDTPRPSHADFTARMRYGDSVDMRGGGHFSGRLTAPLCVAGGIARQILSRRGIFIGAHLSSVAGIDDTPFPLHPTRELFDELVKKPVPAINNVSAQLMAQAISSAAESLDSVGGVIECAVTGLDAGIGNPMFDGVENRLASAVFGVPGVKGLEFGSGFAGSGRHGSENNDPFIIENGRVSCSKNDSGGILGGITTGMPVVFRAAMKPTASISRPQETVSLSAMEPAELTIKGRHDPCIALRAVPVIEAVTASVILDFILEGK